ncbi:MAG: hypothetical protein Q4B43_07645 [Bacteroidota bacterium]|nr:hypothetical protein [Bacteroidota bacterium]
MKQILLFIFLISCSLSLAQTIAFVSDEALVAQEKRMVFQTWGEWKPEGNNIHRVRIWGSLAPQRNRDYKEGEDIRPLRIGGKENNRFLLSFAMREQAEKIKEEIDTLDSRAKADFLHWIPGISNADPLYLLYYKDMLTPLINIPDNPSSYLEWGIASDLIYQKALANGSIQNLQKTLDVLKDYLKKSKEVAMPRGKRFLLYHQCLIGWRKFERQRNRLNEMYTRFLDIEKLTATSNSNVQYMNNDKQIIQAVLDRHQILFL